MKKERRLSSRRQSQDDIEDITDQKVDSSTSTHLSGTELEEPSASSSESQKKMVSKLCIGMFKGFTLLLT